MGLHSRLDRDLRNFFEPFNPRNVNRARAGAVVAVGDIRPIQNFKVHAANFLRDFVAEYVLPSAHCDNRLGRYAL